MASKTQTQETTAAAQLNNAGGIPVFDTFDEFYAHIESMNCDDSQGSAQTEISPEVWNKRAHLLGTLSQENAYLHCLYSAAHDKPLATHACVYAIGCKVDMSGYEKCMELSKELDKAIKENNNNEGQVPKIKELEEEQYEESCRSMFP